MNFFSALRPALCAILFATLAAPALAQSTSETPAVPQSQIQPAGLLQYAYQRWQVIAANKYQCNELKVIAASNYKKAENGNVTEVWQTEVCGQQRRFTTILVPSVDGNIVVAFSEKES